MLQFQVVIVFMMDYFNRIEVLFALWCNFFLFELSLFFDTALYVHFKWSKCASWCYWMQNTEDTLNWKSNTTNIVCFSICHSSGHSFMWKFQVCYTYGMRIFVLHVFFLLSLGIRLFHSFRWTIHMCHVQSRFYDIAFNVNCICANSQWCKHSTCKLHAFLPFLCIVSQRLYV